MGTRRISEEQDAPDLSRQSRTLRNSIISLTVFFVLVVGLLLAVPSLHSVLSRIEHASPVWLATAVADTP